MTTFRPITTSGPGSLRSELTAALQREAQRLQAALPDDEDEAARLRQLVDLWRSGHRGIAPHRLPPSTPADRLVEAQGLLG